MVPEERRRFRRAALRLRVTRLEGLGPAPEQPDLWTADVSAGGMFLHVPLDAPPPEAATVHFELDIPPGEGYSCSAGKIRGSGKVVRAMHPGAAGLDARPALTGLAVQFTRPLTLDF